MNLKGFDTLLVESTIQGKSLLPRGWGANSFLLELIILQNGLGVEENTQHFIIRSRDTHRSVSRQYRDQTWFFMH